MKTKLIIAAFLLVAIFSCEKQKLDKMEIKIGAISQACVTPSDSLMISSETIVYNMAPNCFGNNWNVEQAVDAEDWDEILQLFDWKTFKGVKSTPKDVGGDAYNYIEIHYGASVHRVCFNSTDDEALAPIRLFAEKLAKMRLPYYTQGLVGALFNK